MAKSSLHEAVTRVLESDPTLLARAQAMSVVDVPAEDGAALRNGIPAEAQDSAATILIKLAREKGQFFHSGENCYATIAASGHEETLALRSRTFRSWLGKLFYERGGRAANSEAISSAIETLSGVAVYDGQEHPVFVRFASWEGKIYVDLADENWRVAEVGDSGWHVIDSNHCPVRFRRARGMLALPMPERGGNLNELRPFLNVSSQSDFYLIAGCLVATLCPSGPYPILIFYGEHGSAKSSSARLLRNLIDPNVSPLRSEPREVRDLMIAATNSRICAFDNVSHIPAWLSDCLCRLSTGGGFSTRQLYSDSDEIIFETERPVILNSIGEIATRSDLLDRAILIYQPPIKDEKRIARAKLDAEFNRAHPRLLGALLDAASSALANLPSINLKNLPRMADFAIWVSAAESALGWKRGEFLRAYVENRRQASDLPLENSVVVALGKLELPWNGTATELLAALESLTDDRTRRSKSWPNSGWSLSNTLRRLAPNLRQTGVLVRFERDSNKKRSRLITISDAAGISASDVSGASAFPQPYETENTYVTPSSDAADAADAVPPSISVVERDEEVI
jgi:hypothetical protein